MESITIDGNEYQVTLGDDGTLDTVVEVFDVTSGKLLTWRYSHESASYYRDAEGYLDLEAFVRDTVGPDAAVYDWDDEPTPDEEQETLAALDRAIDDCLEANGL